MNKTTFNDYHFCEILQSSLQRLGIIHPTPIQEKAIPLALEGKDILGSAQTGTGKTLAFLLPILEKLLVENSSRGAVLILAPTRELAAQILKAVHDLLPKKNPIKTALLIGGDSIGKQFAALRQHPHIVVGTPGRVNDHLARNSLQLRETRFFVLDECDRMMDMGFEPQIQEIIKLLPATRQTFMFSATLSPSIVKLSHKYLHHPERVAVGEQHKVSNIKQEMIQVKPPQKYSALVKELEKREGSVVIFVKTKQGAEELADRLEEEGHFVKAIHGDLPQRKREKVILAFRHKRCRILVATDVAARGLDIPHIEHVINYDLPQTPEDYMHRIGRTARAGKKGEALSFVSPADERRWKDIQRFFQQKYVSSPQEQKRKPSHGYAKAKGRPRYASSSDDQARKPRYRYSEAKHKPHEQKTSFKPKNNKIQGREDKPLFKHKKKPAQKRRFSES